MTSPPTKQPPFADSRLKVERAEKHIAYYRRLENRFRNSNPYVVTMEKNPNPSHGPLEAYLWRLSVHGHLSPKMALAIGDAVHNLRAALDILMCDAVRRGGAKDCVDVSFPIAKSEKAFKSQIKHGLIQPAGPRILDAIPPLEPYPGGRLFLWDLHQLDIVDKHRLLLPTVPRGGIPVLIEDRDSGLLFGDLDYQRPMIDGAVWDKTPDFGLPDIHIGGHFEPTFKVQFGDGVPFKDEPIIPTLLQLRDATLEVVDILESCL